MNLEQNKAEKVSTNSDVSRIFCTSYRKSHTLCRIRAMHQSFETPPPPPPLVKAPSCGGKMQNELPCPLDGYEK